MPTNAKYKFTNPYFFWGLILVLLFITFFLNQYFTHSPAEAVKTQSSIVEQSHKDGAHDETIVVDVDNLSHMDFEKHQPKAPKDKSFFTNLKDNIYKNSTLLLLLLYTTAISILFIYREKQNSIKLLNMEKIEDALRIEIAEEEGKTYLFELIKDDLAKHKDTIEPELKLDRIEEGLVADPRYIIINARVILEKTILRLYKHYFNEEATLNEMMQSLYRKRVLNPALNNYAHTIKAFGNKAVHPTLDTTTAYQPKDALLVLGTLSQYLQDLKSADLPEK